MTSHTATLYNAFNELKNIPSVFIQVHEICAYDFEFYMSSVALRCMIYVVHLVVILMKQFGDSGFNN